MNQLCECSFFICENHLNVVDYRGVVSHDKGRIQQEDDNNNKYDDMPMTRVKQKKKEKR